MVYLEKNRDIMLGTTCPLSQSPRVSGLLLSLFKEFNSYDETLKYRQRSYGTLHADHFEDVVEQSFSKLIFFEGDHLGIKYRFIYALELLVSKFPSEAVNLLSTLVEEVERERWSEGSALVRAKLILISGLVNQFTNFENRHRIDIQQNLLRTNSGSIRAFGGALIASNIFQPEEHGPTTAEIISSLRILPDEEYRLVLAAAISETIGKGKTNSFLERKLYENWEGDSDLVKRIAKVLSGRLHGNHSLYITEKFLIPLSVAEPRFQSVPITIWNEILVAKLSFVEDVGKSSSESIKTEFSIVTDAELTNTIVRIVGGLDDQSQSGIISNWFSALDLLWKTIRQPFAQQISYSKFYKSATSVYWIKLILEVLVRANELKTNTLNQITTYQNDYQKDLDIVNDFISRQRVSIGQVMEIRETGTL